MYINSFWQGQGEVVISTLLYKGKQSQPLWKAIWQHGPVLKIKSLAISFQAFIINDHNYRKTLSPVIFPAAFYSRSKSKLSNA